MGRKYRGRKIEGKEGKRRERENGAGEGEERSK